MVMFNSIFWVIHLTIKKNDMLNLVSFFLNMVDLGALFCTPIQKKYLRLSAVLNLFLKYLLIQMRTT